MKKPKEIRWREIAETALADIARLTIQHHILQCKFEQAIEEHSRTLMQFNATLSLILTIRERLTDQDGYEDLVHAIGNLPKAGLH